MENSISQNSPVYVLSSCHFILYTIIIMHSIHKYAYTINFFYTVHFFSQEIHVNMCKYTHMHTYTCAYTHTNTYTQISLGNIVSKYFNLIGTDSTTKYT